VKGLWYIAAVALLLAGCQTSLITDLTAPSGSILYRDDFSNPASGWLSVETSSWSEGYAVDSYTIQVNIPQYDLWAVSGQTFGDVTVEADATRLGGPDVNRFGLICRYQGPKDFYFFVISSDGYYAIGKTLDGTASLLGQEMMAFNPVIVKGAGPNLLRFDCISSTLTGYVNGQVVASTQDKDFEDGDAGLIAGTFTSPGVQIAFGNFLVIKP
jgi:hypothetical protein